MSGLIDDKTRKRFANLTNMFDITSKNEIEFSSAQKEELGQLDSSQETSSMIEGSSKAWGMFAIPVKRKKTMDVKTMKDTALAMEDDVDTGISIAQKDMGKAIKAKKGRSPLQ